MLKKEEKLFNEVFLQFHPLLYGFGKKIISDDYIIEECIQELFIYIYQKEIKLASIKNIKAYLLTAFRRRILLKKAKTPKYQALSSMPSDLHFQGGDFMNPSTDPQKSSQLATMLNELPWRQREAIYLKYFNDLSAKEVSEIMGIQPQVVANMVYKALKKLRSSSSHLWIWPLYFFDFL